VTERNARRALIGLVVLAAALRFWRIGHQSLWLDEVFTANLVDEDLWGMLKGVRETESTPHLYYVLAWVWARIVGDGEAALRSLPALFGIASVPVAYLAARELFKPGAALIAAALVAVNPWFVWYSQEARSYALLMLVATAALLFFLRALRTRSPRDLALWALFASLAVLTHYFAAFLVGAEALWLLWTLRNRAAAAATGALLATGLAVAPLAISQRGEGHTAFIEDIALKTRVVDLPKRFVTGELGTPTPLIGPLAGALVLLGLVYALWAAPGSAKARALAALAAVSVAVPIALDLLGLDLLLPRNAIAAYVPLAIVLGFGFAASRTGVAAGALLAGIMLAVTIQISLNSDLQRDDWRAAAEDLREGRPGDVGVVITSDAQVTPLEHYLPELRPYPPGEDTELVEIAAVEATREDDVLHPAVVPIGFGAAISRFHPSFVIVRHSAASPTPVSPEQLDGLKLDDEPAALRLYSRTP
jgi:4-amino-4-deoxy-L-arabinose transferase-like glycosyltransferase